jgi:putative flavoprotein involved in K+ transport
VIIGASQAGLAMGYHLAQKGLRFVILDAGPEIGHLWRSRWDSLVLFTPAQHSGLPGMAFPGPENTYPSRDDVVSYLQAYATTFDLPVRLNSKVTSLTKDDNGYVVATPEEPLKARQVVVATGPFQVAFTPDVSAEFDKSVFQIHSADYRKPAQIPEGRVLVVGGGNSGFQIAEELTATREVGLAVGKRMLSLPQRLLGKDIFWWLARAGYMKVNAGSRLGQRLSRRDALIGSSPKKARRAGVTTRGLLSRAVGRRAVFADGDQLEVDVVVWATGYRLDHSWIAIPEVKDEHGRIMHKRGVTVSPGLYLLGQTWQHTRGSALVGWVGNDAAFLAEQIASLTTRRSDQRAASQNPTDTSPAAPASNDADHPTEQARRSGRRVRL